jgi:hypothetical protein
MRVAAAAQDARGDRPFRDGGPERATEKGRLHASVSTEALPAL